MKEHIQDILDEMVAKHQERGFAGTYYGVPLEEFTKAELLAVIDALGKEQLSMRERHIRSYDVTPIEAAGRCGIL